MYRIVFLLNEFPSAGAAQFPASFLRRTANAEIDMRR